MSDRHDLHHLPGGSDALLPYRAAVVVPDPHLHRRVDPPSPQADRVALRKLSAGQQALLALAYLRKDERFAELAAGSGIGTAAAWRYATETVALLAARSPKLRSAPRAAKQAGHAYVGIDGTLVPVDRVAADRRFYAGEHRHGMNLQVIASPDGEIVWVSGPLPGAVHGLNAARIWGIVRELAAAGLVVLADKGYHGAGDHIRTPTGGRTSRNRRRPPTVPTPSCAAPANAPTPSSKPGASCANSAAARGGPGSWPKPSTCFRPAKSEDEGPLLTSSPHGMRWRVLRDCCKDFRVADDQDHPEDGQDADDTFDRRVGQVLDEQAALLREQTDLLIATGSISVERPTGVLTAHLRPPTWWRRGELVVRAASSAGSSASGRIPLSRAAYRDHTGLRGEIRLQIAVHLAGLEEE